MLQRPTFRRYAVLLAATAVALSGCAARDAGLISDNRSGTTGNPTAAKDLPIHVANATPCSQLSAQPQDEPLPAERLPAIELPCLTERTWVNLSEPRGKPVVINLWATWCGPCRQEMPLLQQAHNSYGDRVQFLGVNTKDDPARAGAFLDEVGVTFPQVVDVDGKLLAHTHTPGLPVTIVLDPEGRLIARHVGPISRPQLDSLTYVA